MTVLNVQITGQYLWSVGIEYCILLAQTPDIIQISPVQQNIQIGTPQNPTSTPYPTFPDTASAIAYYETTMAGTLLSQVNTTIGSTYYTSTNIETVDTSTEALFLNLQTELAAVSASIPTNVSQLTNDANYVTSTALAGALTSYPTTTAMNTALSSYATSASLTSGLSTKQNTITTGTTLQYLRGDLSLATLPTALPPNGTAGGDLTGTYPNPTLAASGVTAATYAYPSSVVVDAKGRVTAITAGSAPSTPSFSTTTRSFATAFQISSTRNAIVNYSVPVTSAATLLAGSQAGLTWKYADDVSMTTNVVTLPPAQFGASSGLVVTAVGTLGLSGVIPAGKYVMISQNTLAGTPTYSSTISAQEVLI